MTAPAAPLTRPAMTGEKDPRDVMQAEHDAGLSEHPAFRAPAEMPGVEDGLAADMAIAFGNPREAEVMIMARSDAEFDKRDWIGMSKTDRERYTDRARASHRALAVYRLEQAAIRAQGE